MKRRHYRQPYNKSTEEYRRDRRRDEFAEQQRQATLNGYVNERRVVNALLDAVKEVSWIANARLATRHEDRHQHFDVVAMLDIGEVHIQVKSSFHEARLFFAEHNELMDDMLIVVVRENQTREELRSKIVADLEKMRKKRLPSE